MARHSVTYNIESVENETEDLFMIPIPKRNKASDYLKR